MGYIAFTPHWVQIEFSTSSAPPETTRFKPQTSKQRSTRLLEPPVYLVYLLICFVFVWLEQRWSTSLKWHWQHRRGRVRLLCEENWESVQPVAERDASVSFMPPSAFSSGLPLRITRAHVTLRQQSQTLRLKPRGVYKTPPLNSVSRSFNPSYWQSGCRFGR